MGRDLHRASYCSSEYVTKSAGAMGHGILMRGTKNGAITVVVVVWI
ncbi:hypothetical protein CEXT_549421, partial [Caerostris extrusa]